MIRGENVFSEHAVRHVGHVRRAAIPSQVWSRWMMRARVRGRMVNGRFCLQASRWHRGEGGIGGACGREHAGKHVEHVKRYNCPGPGIAMMDDACMHGCGVSVKDGSKSPAGLGMLAHMRCDTLPTCGRSS